VAFVWIITVLAWTAVFFRALGARSVAGAGVMVRWWLLSMLWGPIVLGCERNWIASPVWSAIFDPILLWIPVGACLLWRRSYRYLSVSDGFLMGFWLGFGYDWMEELFGIVFRDVARPNLLASLSIMPPTILASNSGLTAHHYAQHGYWLALPSLALCAGLRFTSKGAAAGLSVLTLAACGLDRGTWMGLPDSVSTVLESVLCHGLLIPWLALFGLLVLSIYESHWVARGLGRADPVFHIPLEWSAILSALADRNWAAAMNLDERARLLRQFDLVRRERLRHPGDGSLGLIEQGAARRFRELPQPKDAGASVRMKWKLWWPQETVLAISALLVFVLPYLNPTAQQHAWATIIKLPGYFGSEISLPALILLVFSAWVCLVFPAHPETPGEPAPTDPGLRHFVERWMRTICLAAFLFLLVCHTNNGWGQFISVSAPILEQWNLNLYTDFSDAQWAGYLAMFMALAAITMISSATALRLERPLRFRAAVQRHLAAAVCSLPWLLLAWKMDWCGMLQQALNQQGIYGGWDYRWSCVLTIVLLWLATWTTRWVGGFVFARLHTLLAKPRI
jgi:hypothetical protein